MDLVSQIFTRKSCRKYLDEKIDMAPVHQFMSSVKPLTPEINYSYKILTRDEVSLKTIWSAPYYLAIYSDKKETIN